MNRNIEPTPDHRRRVATLLALLASEKSQTELARETDRERIAYELARGWFDRVYVPGGSYIDGLKGDFSTDAAERFRDDFDPVELAAMERFNRFFELRMEMIPPDFIERRSIPINERWRSLMRDAAYLLDDLGVNLSDLQGRLPSDGAHLSALIRTGG